MSARAQARPHCFKSRLVTNPRQLTDDADTIDTVRAIYDRQGAAETKPA